MGGGRRTVAPTTPMPLIYVFSLVTIGYANKEFADFCRSRSGGGGALATVNHTFGSVTSL